MAEETFENIGKIEAIRLLYEDGGFQMVEGNPFLSEKGSSVLSASRLYLEGIDFDLTYFPLQHLGYKCVIGVAGELYASLARPRTLSVILGVSAKLDFKEIRDIWTGVTSAAKEHNFVSVSLDLIPSRNGLTISISATGEVSELTRVRRMGAKSKDLICVSDNLGAAYMGLQVLEREKQTFEKTKDDMEQPDLEKYKLLVGAYLKPYISPDIVRRFEEEEIYPSYGYFISRGLSDAVRRLVRDCGLGAKIYADKIPFEGNTFALGKEMNIDPISAAMNGGDDFRLLFTVPILSLERFRREFQTFDIIGHLAQKDVGPVLVSPDGVELPIKAQGWND
jgi:thiamine-monophosphate kinase